MDMDIDLDHVMSVPITVPDLEEGDSASLDLSCPPPSAGQQPGPSAPSSHHHHHHRPSGNGLLPLPSPSTSLAAQRMRLPPHHPRSSTSNGGTGRPLHHHHHHSRHPAPGSRHHAGPPAAHGPSSSSSSTAVATRPSTTTSTSSSSSRGSSSLLAEGCPPLRQFAWSDFDILQKVGEGTTGSVYKAKLRGTEMEYALKVFRHENDMGVSISALQEIKSFQRLRTLKYIVRLVGFAFTPKDEFVLVEEYMAHDLAGLMHSKQIQKFTEPHIKCIMHQLLSGLHECHQMKLIHRDIKSSNILMHRGHLRITDFGFMTTVENAALYQSCEIITLWYRPPELLLGTTKYGQEVDLWSAGCIFFELLTMEIAFRGRTSKDQLVLLFKTLGKPTEATWPGVTSMPLWGDLGRDIPPYPNTLRERLTSGAARVSPQALDLLAALLTLDPKHRITAAQALAHPFFTHGVAPCKPADLPHFKEAHEYELKKLQQQEHQQQQQQHQQLRGHGGHGTGANGANGHRRGPPGGAVAGGSTGGGGGQRRPVAGGGGPHGPGVNGRSSREGHQSHHHQHQGSHHPSSHQHHSHHRSRGGPHDAAHHPPPPREEKRPEADVDWILNREKPSARPAGSPPTASTAPPPPTTTSAASAATSSSSSRGRRELASPPPAAVHKKPKRESSLPLLADTGDASVERSRSRRGTRPEPAPASPPPAHASHERSLHHGGTSANTTNTTNTDAGTANGTGGGEPPRAVRAKPKLIQPVRKSSPTRSRLPTLPISSLPVRRDTSSSSSSSSLAAGSRSPPSSASSSSSSSSSSAPSSTGSSKITIRRSKVGDKPVLRIVSRSPPLPPSVSALDDSPPPQPPQAQQQQHQREAATGKRRRAESPGASAMGTEGVRRGGAAGGIGAGQGHPRKVARRGTTEQQQQHHQASSSPPPPVPDMSTPSPSSSSSSLSPSSAPASSATTTTTRRRGGGAATVTAGGSHSNARQSRQRQQKAPPAARTTTSTTKEVAVAPPPAAASAMIDDDEDDESKLYCTCRQPNDPSRWMVWCDHCNGWFHGDCEGVTQEETSAMPTYKCRRCRARSSAH